MMLGRTHIKNGAGGGFLGPRGAAGTNGATGPTGPAGVVMQSLVASAGLTNITAITNFSLVTAFAANFFTVGKIARMNNIIRWSTGAAQSLNVYSNIGSAVQGSPALAIAGATNGTMQIETIVVCVTTGVGGTANISYRGIITDITGATVLAFSKSLGPVAMNTTIVNNFNGAVGSTVANNTFVEDSHLVETFN